MVRVGHQELSLWQSAVAEVVENSIQSRASRYEIYSHPMVQTSNEFVCKVMASNVLPDSTQEPEPATRDFHLASYFYQLARAKVTGDKSKIEELEAAVWPYSNDDYLGWATCLATYLKYKLEYGQTCYRDWTVAGGNNIDYGVIEWQLPNDATVAIIGDWGTGLDDAKLLLIDALVNHTPDVVIHLGDIYYSGTPNECTSNFYDIVQDAFSQTGVTPVPVLTIPGNHDYFAFGHGFFPLLDQLNPSFPTAKQAASYFCLRTQDGLWQFLGADTGLGDPSPSDEFNPVATGPGLRDTEVQWHVDKLQNFEGATILMTHHQLFSANTTLNGSCSVLSELPYINPFLYNIFQPYFQSRIAAWFWGHEHNLVLFQNGLNGLAKGRLVGASAYEEDQADDPYEVKNPGAPYLDPTQYQLEPQPGNDYYPHAYAIIDLARQAPSDPVNISYYAFPSFYPSAPSTANSVLVYSEYISPPTTSTSVTVSSGAPITLSMMGGLTYISAVDSGSTGYYPTAGTTPVTLTIKNPNDFGTLHSGDWIELFTTETTVSGSTQLYAGLENLYYDVPAASNSFGTWQIVKIDWRTTEVNFGDAVYFLNQEEDAWICPTGQYFTTTLDGPPIAFVIGPSM